MFKRTLAAAALFLLLAACGDSAAKLYETALFEEKQRNTGSTAGARASGGSGRKIEIVTAGNLHFFGLCSSRATDSTWGVCGNMSTG